MIKINSLENNIKHLSFDGISKLNALTEDYVKNELLKLFEVENTNVIIDLEDITYIDSSGFGCFLVALKRAKSNFGTLKICKPIPEIKALFHTLQLHTIFELYDDLELCINSFQTKQ